MKKLLIVWLALFFSLSLVWGEETIKLRILGQAPLTPPVTGETMAKRIVAEHIESIRELEGEEIFFAIAKQLKNAGVKKEILPPGTKMKWMLFKDRNGKVRNIQNVEWAGDKPVEAFCLEIICNEKVYRLAIPQICGNISLIEIKRVEPLPQPEPQKPEEPQSQKPVEPQKPIVTPPVINVPQLIAQKSRPNFKIKIGPWIPAEPMIFSYENTEIDMGAQFVDYLPKYEKFLICESGETAVIYLNEKNFPYQTRDSVWLKKQRSLQQLGWSGIQFSIGVEGRIWKGLWLGVDYYQSRKFKISISETLENMYFKNVEYVGYYTAPPQSSIFCPPQYHIYSMKLNRHLYNLETNYTFMSREVDFLLRYYLNLGPSSFFAATGLAVQQLEEKTKEQFLFDVLLPFKDEVIAEEEETNYYSKDKGFKKTWIAGIGAELKFNKYLSVSVEGAYRKFPERKEVYPGIISDVPQFAMNFKNEPWRATATLNLIF